MRLFVALNPPAAERERIDAAVEPLRAARLPVRWVGPAQRHLTLKFLGEVAEARVPEVTEAVEAAAATVPPFEVEWTAVGAFPSLRRPRVVWLGVTPARELTALHEELERRFERLGFERENRDLAPHLTLGRAQRDARPPELRDLERLAAQVAFAGRVRFETLDLMRSRLRPTGAEYDVLRAAPLGEGAGG